MKQYICLSLLLLTANAFSAELRINLDKDITLVESSPDTNYSSFEKFMWVGTNFSGSVHQSMYGFDLSSFPLPINDITSISFNAFVADRHGQGGDVHASLGIDNAWDEDTATYTSHASKFGVTQDTILLHNGNLLRYASWNIDVSDFLQALSAGNSTIYLYTTDVGADGTNFHDIAGVDYSNGAVIPYLSIQVNDLIPGTQCTENNRLVQITTDGAGQNATVNKSLTITFTGHLTDPSSLVSGPKNRVSICSGTMLQYVANTNTDNVTCFVNDILSASAGTVTPGDKLLCTNDPSGSDVDRFSILDK